MKRSAALLWAGLTATAIANAQAPSIETRRQVLRSLVQVTATDCPDGSRRSGSGFALAQPGFVVTAHHVVGGCRTIRVSYEAPPAAAGKLRSAQISKVFAAGDLSLLQVADPPEVPTLRLTSTLPPRDQIYAGFGYALGMPTAHDQEVRFTVGASRLSDILPDYAAQELRQSGSRIATEREVLRFNVALQPGMSGGPIVNAAGEVIGVVAGGLKAGAAPASWGWPAESVRRLLASGEAITLEVRLAGSHYSLSDLEQIASASLNGRRLQCGGLEFTDNGVHNFGDLMRGTDDWPRVQHIMNLSRETPQALGALQFQVWVHQASGATALVPAGYALRREGDTCVARSTQGPLQLLVWGAATPTPNDVQWRSNEFEQRIIGPRMPYNFGSQIDPQLTTFAYYPATGQNLPGPQMRSNGLVFNRKGFILPKRPMQFPGDVVPVAHGFHTLVARGGSFIGVAALNDEVHPGVSACAQLATPQQGCIGAMLHLKEWTRFVLATQLSTFPAF